MVTEESENRALRDIKVSKTCSTNLGSYSNMEDKKGEDNNAQKKCDNPMIKDRRFNMRDDLAAMVFCCTSSSTKT
ncbi:hypothetical protein YC2023_017776 [Brassica napus]